MADLKTTYKDDVLNTSANEKRKYNMITNEDGTVSLVDVTDYSQVGDSFGAADINATNEKVNELNTNLYTLDYANANVISKGDNQYRPSSYTAPSKGQLITAGLTNTTGGKLITVNVNGKFITYVQGSYYSRVPLILTLNKGDVVSFEYEDTNVSFYSFVFVPYK